MSSAQLETIFRDFEQVSTVEENVPKVAGVGLGLAVCARIVQNLGGQLRVESKENVGSKFTFVLPFMLPSLLPDHPDARNSMPMIGGNKPLTNGASGEVKLDLSGPVRRASAGSSGSRKSVKSEIESLITAMATSHMKPASALGHPLPVDASLVDVEEISSPQLKDGFLAPIDDRTASRRDSNSSSRSSSLGASTSPSPVFTRTGIRRNVEGPSHARSLSPTSTPPDRSDHSDRYDVAIEFESESTSNMENNVLTKSPALASYRDFKPTVVTPQDADQVHPLRVLVVEVSHLFLSLSNTSDRRIPLLG